MAILVAAMLTVALSVGAPGPANAASTEIHVVFQPIASQNQMFWILTDAPSGTPLQVWVNGVHKDTVPLQTYPTGEDYITYKPSWGFGTVQIRDGATASKPLPMMAAIDLDRYELRRVGPGAKKVRVKVTAKRYDPVKNTWTKAPKTVLQAKKKGKWKNVRKIKLNKKGKGKVTFKPKGSFKYRFVVKQTKQNLRTVKVTGKF